MELKIYEKIIVETALKGSKWENMKFFLEGSIQKERYRNLWNGYQCVVFNPIIDANAFLKLEKKSSEAYFMGKQELSESTKHLYRRVRFCNFHTTKSHSVEN